MEDSFTQVYKSWKGRQSWCGKHENTPNSSEISPRLILSYNSHEMLKTFSTPLCAVCLLCPLCPLYSLRPLCPLVCHVSPVSPFVPHVPSGPLCPLCPFFHLKNMKYPTALSLFLIRRENFDGFQCFHMTTCGFFFARSGGQRM